MTLLAPRLLVAFEIHRPEIDPAGVKLFLVTWRRSLHPFQQGGLAPTAQRLRILGRAGAAAGKSHFIPYAGDGG